MNYQILRNLSRVLWKKKLKPILEDEKKITAYLHELSSKALPCCYNSLSVKNDFVFVQLN